MRHKLALSLSALAMMAGVAMPAFSQTAAAPASAVSVKDDPWCSPRAQFTKLEAEHPKLFSRLDADGDNMVSQAEFITLCTPYDGHSESRKTMAGKVAKHFATFDKNSDQILTLEEYSKSIMQ